MSNECSGPDVAVVVEEAETELGGVARLPCDLTTPITMDSLSLVIWYKDDGKSPIYRCAYDPDILLNKFQ
jgi:hypothetical protein